MRKLLVLANTCFVLILCAAGAWIVAGKPKPKGDWRPPASPDLKTKLPPIRHFRATETLPLRPTKKTFVAQPSRAVDPNLAFLKGKIQVLQVFLGPPGSANCRVSGRSGMYLWFEGKTLPVWGRKVTLVEGSVTREGAKFRIGSDSYFLVKGGGVRALGSGAGGNGEGRRVQRPINGNGDGKRTARFTSTQRLSEHKYHISGAEQDEVYNKLSTYLSEVGIVPHTRGGRTIGLRITSVPIKSYARSRGFLKGDIITQVNTFKLESVKQIDGLKNALRNSSALRVHFIRNGRELRKVFKLRR